MTVRRGDMEQADQDLLARLEFVACEPSNILSEEIEEVCDLAHARIWALLNKIAVLEACKHTTLHGTWHSDGRFEQRCNACGIEVPPQIRAVSGMANFSMCEGMRNLGGQRGSAGCQHEWRGPGPKPRQYTCGCGTVVFSTHEAAD